MTGCTITGNNTGISTDQFSGGTYHENTIANNTSYGLYYTGATTLNATNNNWGDPTGPLDDSDDRAAGGLYNPTGLGNKVSDHVNYYPWTGANIAPTIGNLTPNALVSPPAVAQTFNAVYRDAIGYANLTAVDFLVSPSGRSGVNALWARYDRNVNKLYLYNDAGNAFVATTCTPGTSGSIANTQGTLKCATTTVISSGNDLTVNWN